MLWIAPSEKDTATATLEKRLWDAADPFRANSGLTAREYSARVLAKPPFNVNAVDKERLKNMVGPGRRLPFDLLRTNN